MAVLVMRRGTGPARVFPFAGQKGFNGFAGVAGTAAMDFNPLEMENIHRPGSHVARQENGNAFGGQNRRNVGLAPASRERRQNPGLLNRVVIINRKQTVLPAMAKMVITVWSSWVGTAIIVILILLFSFSVLVVVICFHGPFLLCALDIGSPGKTCPACGRAGGGFGCKGKKCW